MEVKSLNVYYNPNSLDETARSAAALLDAFAVRWGAARLGWVRLTDASRHGSAKRVHRQGIHDRAIDMGIAGSAYHS